MSKMKRTLALLATLAMMSTSFVACGGDKEDESKTDGTTATTDAANGETTPEGETAAPGAEETNAPMPEFNLTDDDPVLTIVCWNENDLGNMGPLYEAETGKVYGTDVVYQNCGDSGTAASTEYATYLKSDDDIDLFVAEAGWILQYINNYEYAAPLSEVGIDASAFSNAYDYTVKIATNNDGQLMGASWQAAPGGYVYNTTLAETHLGITTPEDMQTAIGDWAGFEATAEKLKTATNGEVKMTATMAGLWQCYSTGNNAVWVKDGVIQTDAAKSFADMAKKYVDAGYVDASIPQWEDPWFAAGNDGKTLGYFFSTWCLPAGAQLQQCGGTDGNWRIVEGPQNYFWGGSWLCVSPKCNTKTEAANFINFFTTNTETMQKYAEESGDYVNNKVAMDNIIAAGTNANALLGGQDQFAVLKEVAEGITMDDTITKYDQNLKDTFNATLNENMDKSVDEIITLFTDKALADNSDLTLGE